MSEVKFGWIPASADKRYLHSQVYAWGDAVPTVVETVEKKTELDRRFVEWYDQDGKNACVGASSAKLMATLNLGQLGAQQYDWWKHYCWACEHDNDLKTTCKNDIGTFIFAGLDCLRKQGAYIVNKGWNLEHGIDRYLWAKNADDCRSAIAIGQLLEFGLPWFSGWMKENLIKKWDYWWIPNRNKWGKQIGGHAIGGYDALDSIQGIGISNTWGNNYPEKVYIEYDDINYLLNQLGAECAIVIDRDWVPPVLVEESITLNHITMTDSSGVFTATKVILNKIPNFESKFELF